jgi:hypothetical protein
LFETLSTSLASYLKESVEFQAFEAGGFWAPTILASIGVVITSCMEIWGLWQQAMELKRERSGESVSVTLFYFTAWYFLVCGIYGAYVPSLSALFSGVSTAVVQIPILWYLWRFKKFRWWEKLLACAFPLMPLALVLVPAQWRDTLYSVLAVSAGAAWGAQPWELWVTKKSGVVNPALFGVWLVTTSVWMWFVLSVGNIPLIINQITATTMIVATIVLWCWYRAREPNPPQMLCWFQQLVRRVLA